MTLSILLKVLLGACIGGVAGWLVARTALCSAGVCRTKAHWLGMAVAGAFFGAAVAWYVVNR